jgi:hypothetical protein
MAGSEGGQRRQRSNGKEAMEKKQWKRSNGKEAITKAQQRPQSQVNDAVGLRYRAVSALRFCCVGFVALVLLPFLLFHGRSPSVTVRD